MIKFHATKEKHFWNIKSRMIYRIVYLLLSHNNKQVRRQSSANCDNTMLMKYTACQEKERILPVKDDCELNLAEFE